MPVDPRGREHRGRDASAGYLIAFAGPLLGGLLVDAAHAVWAGFVSALAAAALMSLLAAPVRGLRRALPAARG